jgi:hypothetical protein
MMQRPSRLPIAVATLLSLLLIALTAAPAAAGEPKRFEASERLAHKLVNCLRTGGKVTVGGKCKGYGSGRYSARRPPLKRSVRISNKVSWPWAQRTVKANICGHELAGSTVDKRFRVVGLKSIVNGENIGCATSWSPRKMVITMVRWWYAEKAYGGPHWKQIKAWKFKSAGFGVAKLGNGRSRLVVNFYGKRVR